MCLFIFVILFFLRINAIEAELKQTHTINGQMKKDVKGLKQVIFMIKNDYIGYQPITIDRSANLPNLLFV
jgi:hypothetical protein